MMRVLALACVVGLATAGNVATIDNGALAKQVYAAAVQVPEGDYLVQSVDDDDKTLRNDNNGGRSLYPSANGNGITFRQIDSRTTLIEGDAGKCLSQQWTGQEDGIAVLYDCVFGPNSKNNGMGLRPAKQQWLMIPATGKDVVTSSAKAHKSKPSKPKSKKKAIKKTTKKSSSKSKSSKRSESKLAVRKCNTQPYRRKHPRGCGKHKKHTKRDEMSLFEPMHALEKRASTYGPYFIIAVDHIQDMATRALVNQKGDAAGSSTQLGTVLTEWDSSDRAQMWTLRKASS